MKLRRYFEEHHGRGIIATADTQGNVNAAVYATPHFMDNGQIAFIMRDRLTHKNITENPKATYLFIEEGEVVKGVRLYLEKTDEEQDSAQLKELNRRKGRYPEDDQEPRFLVYFKVTKILPLLGDADPGITL